MADLEKSVKLPPPLETLASVADQPERFATNDQTVRGAALDAAKFIFDLSIQSEAASIPHISTITASLNASNAPQTRSKAKKAQPEANPLALPAIEPTPLESLFIDGLDEEQIWAQISLRSNKICELLGKIFDEQSVDSGLSQDEESDEEIGEVDEGEDFEGFAAGEEMEVDGSMEEFGGSEEDEDEEDETEDEEDDELDDEDLGEDITPLRGESDEEDDNLPTMFDLMREKSSPKSKKHRKASSHGLDDDFFNLDAFNAEIERLEAKKVSSGRLGDEEDDDSDGDLPIDLFSALNSAENLDEDDVEGDASTLYYRDFFEPPSKSTGLSPNKKARKSKVRFNDEVRVQKIKARGKNLPLSAMQPLSAALDDDDDDDEEEDGFDEEFGDDFDKTTFGAEEEEATMAFGDEDEESASDENSDVEGASLDEDTDGGSDGSVGEEVPRHMRETIERLKDDLFAEDEEASDDNLTTHERRMKEIKEQIEAFESENVAPKEWVLMGEATSRSRPHNSLLEEDLEFERVMKAVPVITEDRVQALEDRIKERILASNFDDVERRRPVDDKPFLPSRLLGLSDTKSNRSLAQIYEDEYSAAQNGGVAGEDRDGKLKKEHEDITRLWENICGKLDALCNAHFTPKAPKGTISSVENVLTTTMESALPTSRSVTSILAPEEVFSAPADIRARSELTPAEKKSLHLKQRKSKKRMRDALDKSMDKVSRMKGISGVKKQKQAALESVVKSGKGVTVIGKKRESASGKEKKGRKS